MTDFVKIASVTDLPDPGKRTFVVGGRMVVLVHVGGQFHCLDDVCTHDGGPLGDGCLIGHALACPRHGAKFDVRTGRALTMPATEATGHHEVRIDGQDVLIRLQET